MRKMKFLAVSLFIACMSGCSTQRYVIEDVGYSSWKDGKMLVRKKAIMLDTKTGESWGLAYKKGTPTRDGYGWEALPKRSSAGTP